MACDPNLDSSCNLNDFDSICPSTLRQINLSCINQYTFDVDYEIKMQNIYGVIGLVFALLGTWLLVKSKTVKKNLVTAHDENETYDTYCSLTVNVL